MAPSSTMNTSEATAALRTGDPLAVPRNTTATRPSAATPASALVIRCPNSMIVLSVGAVGMTSPLHSGQWSPQPAPEPDARTNAPQSTTKTVYPRTPQATRETVREEGVSTGLG